MLTRGSALAAIPVVLTGCYVVPMNPDGSPSYAVVAVPAPVATALHARRK